MMSALLRGRVMSIPAAQRDVIAKLCEQRKVDEAFAKLATYADLKQTDLPSLEKRALSVLGEDRKATQAFIAGLLHESGSVRRMARKFAARIPGEGPRALLLLLVETV